METKNFSLHIFSVSMLFIISNSILTTSYFSSAFWQTILCAVFTVLFYFLLIVLKPSIKKQKLFIVFSLFAGTLSAITAFFEFLKFFSTIMSPHSNVLLLFLALFVTVVLFARGKIYAFYKYSLVSAFFVLLIFIICFFAALKIFEFSQFNLFFNKPEFKAMHVINSILTPLVLITFKDDSHNFSKPVLSGIIAGYFILLLANFQVVFTLGNVTAVDFPYLKAVSVISSGLLFTRLDGAIYFIFFTTYITKITVCIKSMRTAIKRLYKNSN